LNARFGLSTTILPDVFTIRFTRREGSLLVPKGFIIPEARPDVTAVKKLLRELGKVNKRLEDIDEERLRFASLRGKIINKIEEIMENANWDEASCQKVRSLINPLRHQIDPKEDVHEIWAETMKETIRLFESLFQSHASSTSIEEETVSDEEEFVIEPE
jgi:hypothetical protein